MIFARLSSTWTMPLVVISACLSSGMPASGQEPVLTEWQITKCRVYADAFQDASGGRKEGLSQSFLDENEAFVAKGCVERVPVCPRTQADLDVANILTIVAMNAGTASTFLPFACAND